MTEFPPPSDLAARVVGLRQFISASVPEPANEAMGEPPPRFEVINLDDIEVGDDPIWMIEGLLPLFDRADVRLVLAGHEHNFQIGQVARRTYVVSGSGGKVREELPDRLGGTGVEAWAAHAHLLLVEIDGKRARLTPISGIRPDGHPQLLTARTARNEIRRPPFVVEHV